MAAPAGWTLSDDMDHQKFAQVLRMIGGGVEAGSAAPYVIIGDSTVISSGKENEDSDEAHASGNASQFGSPLIVLQDSKDDADAGAYAAFKVKGFKAHAICSLSKVFEVREVDCTRKCCSKEI